MFAILVILDLLTRVPYWAWVAGVCAAFVFAAL